MSNSGGGLIKSKSSLSNKFYSGRRRSRTQSQNKRSIQHHFDDYHSQNISLIEQEKPQDTLNERTSLIKKELNALSALKRLSELENFEQSPYSETGFGSLEKGWISTSEQSNGDHLTHHAQQQIQQSEINLHKLSIEMPNNKREHMLRRPQNRNLATHMNSLKFDYPSEMQVAQITEHTQHSISRLRYPSKECKLNLDDSKIHPNEKKSPSLLQKQPFLVERSLQHTQQTKSIDQSTPAIETFLPQNPSRSVQLPTTQISFCTPQDNSLRIRFNEDYPLGGNRTDLSNLQQFTAYPQSQQLQQQHPLPREISSRSSERQPPKSQESKNLNRISLNSGNSLTRHSPSIAISQTSNSYLSIDLEALRDISRKKKLTHKISDFDEKLNPSQISIQNVQLNIIPSIPKHPTRSTSTHSSMSLTIEGVDSSPKQNRGKDKHRMRRRLTNQIQNTYASDKENISAYDQNRIISKRPPKHESQSFSSLEVYHQKCEDLFAAKKNQSSSTSVIDSIVQDLQIQQLPPQEEKKSLKLLHQLQLGFLNNGFSQISNGNGTNVFSKALQLNQHQSIPAIKQQIMSPNEYPIYPQRLQTQPQLINFHTPATPQTHISSKDITLAGSTQPNQVSQNLISQTSKTINESERNLNSLPPKSNQLPGTISVKSKLPRLFKNCNRTIHNSKLHSRNDDPKQLFVSSTLAHSPSKAVSSIVQQQ